MSRQNDHIHPLKARAQFLIYTSKGLQNDRINEGVAVMSLRDNKMAVLRQLGQGNRMKNLLDIE